MAKKRNKYRLDDWSEYTQKADLATWQRFLGILGEDDTLPSKTQCQKAMRGVYVNIRDLIDATRENRPVPRFPSRTALRKYTKQQGKFVCIDDIETGSPMSSLLFRIFF